MFDFAYPTHLLLLASLVIVGLLFWWARASRTAKLKRFGRADVIKALMPDASKYKPRIKITLELLALAAIVLILARPRVGQLQAKQSRQEGIEIVIAFDLSNSMLASSTDNPDGISRIERARLLLEKLLSRLDNDKIGLVIFAAEAKTQMPLTTDHYVAKLYLNDLTPAMMQMQGTSISDAINLASSSFSGNDNIGKAIILITDAENHEGDAIDAAKEAVKKGIQVDVVGVGTSSGAKIPLDATGTNFMRDIDGNEVITKIDEEAAAKIAEAGKGVYVNGASSKALDQLCDALDNLDKGEFRKIEYSSSAEQFSTFAWLAIILLLADLFVLDRKIGWLKNINFFSRNSAKQPEGLIEKKEAEAKKEKQSRIKKE